MKILIIGGTGGTGKQLMTQALELGHEVTALVRNPKKVKISDKNLHVIQGDILNYDDVDKVIDHQEAVLSALGHKKFFIKTTILSRGTTNIIRAMEKHNVKRLICITSLGINESRFKLGLYYTLFVIPFIVLFYFLDKSKQEKIIKSSNLDWTIVRPGQLINWKKRGKYKHGENVGNYLITRFISRADVADFMLKQLTSNAYTRKAVGIVY